MAKDSLAKVQHGESGITTERARVTLATLAAEKETRAAVAGFVADMMKPGVDYGKIPGTDKPTLLKPGAEKLVDLFRCTPRFTLVKGQCREDFTKGFFKYTFKVQLLQRDSDAVLAEGFGSANSMEARYRWRQGKRKCPECGKTEALNKSKPPKQGFYCWDKKGGCGANFGPDDKRITEQVVGRVPNEDIADLDNTILKMAKKRALVDGAIALARCSDMFTQDVEDLMDMAATLEEMRPTPAESHAATGAYTQKMTEDFSEAQATVAKPKPAPLPAAVGFGKHKGRPVTDLSDAELLETIDTAHAKLHEDPEAKWASSMRANLAALEAEANHRSRANAPLREPGQEG